MSLSIGLTAGRRRGWLVAFRSAAAVVLLLLLASGVHAGGGPRDVAIVINADSAISCEIGEYYRAVRGIPATNLCYIHCPDQEVVSCSVCETAIREPVRAFLARPKLAGKIDYIVVTKGVPLAADYGDSSGAYSVTSILTCVDHPSVRKPMCFPYGPVADLEWPNKAPEVAWSHSLDFGGYHFYLVTRLDGFTVAQVKSLIDRSAAPVKTGRFVLDRNCYSGGIYTVANERLGAKAGSAYAILVAAGKPVDYDSGSSFICNEQNVMGYFSWAMLDEYYSFSKYTSNKFVPGSIGDSYYSSSGRTFNDPGGASRPPLIADLINCGLCGCGAYVSEPFLFGATYPNVLFDRYIKGYNMAESFYAACPEVFYKTVVIGDPLMAAYATPPQVALSVPTGDLRDTVRVEALVGDPNTVAQVKFFCDNVALGAVASSPFVLVFDSTKFTSGTHTIEAIAYAKGPTATQGSAKQTIRICNTGPSGGRIGEMLAAADGQSVTLKEKTVTVGSDEAGQGFVVEESDRTAGVRVIGDAIVSRGDVVSVSGNICTINGLKAISDAVVTVVGEGGTPAPPVLVNVRDLGGRGTGCDQVGTSRGARNLNLMVRTYGKVIQTGQGWLLIWDGCKRTAPVKVYCSETVSAGASGYVIVSGLCDSEASGTSFAPVIRVIDSDGVRPLAQAPW